MNDKNITSNNIPNHEILISSRRILVSFLLLKPSHEQKKRKKKYEQTTRSRFGERDTSSSSSTSALVSWSMKQQRQSTSTRFETESKENSIILFHPIQSLIKKLINQTKRVQPQSKQQKNIPYTPTELHKHATRTALEKSFLEPISPP